MWLAPWWRPLNLTWVSLTSKGMSSATKIRTCRLWWKLRSRNIKPLWTIRKLQRINSKWRIISSPKRNLLLKARRSSPGRTLSLPQQRTKLILIWRSLDYYDMLIFYCINKTRQNNYLEIKLNWYWIIDKWWKATFCQNPSSPACFRRTQSTKSASTRKHPVTNFIKMSEWSFHKKLIT